MGFGSLIAIGKDWLSPLPGTVLRDLRYFRHRKLILSHHAVGVFLVNMKWAEKSSSMSWIVNNFDRDKLHVHNYSMLYFRVNLIQSKGLVFSILLGLFFYRLVGSKRDTASTESARQRDKITSKWNMCTLLLLIMFYKLLRASRMNVGCDLLPI